MCVLTLQFLELPHRNRRQQYITIYIIYLISFALRIRDTGAAACCDVLLSCSRHTRPFVPCNFIGDCVGMGVMRAQPFHLPRMRVVIVL